MIKEYVRDYETHNLPGGTAKTGEVVCNVYLDCFPVNK